MQFDALFMSILSSFDDNVVWGRKGVSETTVVWTPMSMSIEAARLHQVPTRQHPPSAPAVAPSFFFFSPHSQLFARFTATSATVVVVFFRNSMTTLLIIRKRREIWTALSLSFSFYFSCYLSFCQFSLKEPAWFFDVVVGLLPSSRSSLPPPTTTTFATSFSFLVCSRRRRISSSSQLYRTVPYGTGAMRCFRRRLDRISLPLSPELCSSGSSTRLPHTHTRTHGR